MSGQTIAGRYELGDRLGLGGMSTVHLAFDRRLEREVAVKLLAEHLAADPAFVERFKREALAAARLVHPNIVQVFDFGLDEGSDRHYIVMEYIRGQSCAEILRDRGQISMQEALAIVGHACRGLDYAHRNGVVHRDVKPGNLLRSDDGLVKLADFGIAKALSDESAITQVGSVLGTAAYLAPEQAHGEEAGPRSDLYSLGVVTYQLVSGKLPYEANSLTELALMQQREAPPLLHELVPDVPPQFSAAVDRALNLNPDDRYATAEEMRAALVDGAKGEGPEPTSATRVVSAAPSRRGSPATPAPPSTSPASAASPAPRPPARRPRRSLARPSARRPGPPRERASAAPSRCWSSSAWSPRASPSRSRRATRPRPSPCTTRPATTRTTRSRSSSRSSTTTRGNAMASYDVRDKVVFITGGARGIGAESAKQLVAKGAKVSLVGLEPEELKQRVAELGPENAVWFEADVTDEDALQAAVEGTVEALGGIDVTIANAGIATATGVRLDEPRAVRRGRRRQPRRRLPHASGHDAPRHRAVGLHAAGRVAGRAMHAPMMGAYSATKAGVEALANCLRTEVAHTGTKVGCAYFGFIDTDMVRRGFETEGGQLAAKKMGPGGPNHSVPVSKAGAAIVRGIERRARYAYAPRWIIAPLLARTIIQPLQEKAMIKRGVADVLEAAARDEQTLTTPQPHPHHL